MMRVPTKDNSGGQGKLAEIHFIGLLLSTVGSRCRQIDGQDTRIIHPSARR